MNAAIMKALGFGAQVVLVEHGYCPMCNTKIVLNEFRDSLSKREYEISGLCQKCQDATFGCGEDNV